MSAEMIHIQFQEQSYINSIDKKNNKSQARVKGNNFEEWQDISPEDSTTLGLGAWVPSKKEKERGVNICQALVYEMLCTQ